MYRLGSDGSDGSDGVFVLGVLVGAIILPVVSLLYIWRATSLSAETGAVGCPLVTILAALAAVGGFVLFQAQPLVHWVPPC